MNITKCYVSQVVVVTLGLKPEKTFRNNTWIESLEA